MIKRTFIYILFFLIGIQEFPLIYGASILYAQSEKPKVLFFSAIDIYYLYDSLQMWGEKRGVNGFMLSYLADWWTPRDKLFKNVNILKKVNLKGEQYGVDSNFIKVALGYRELPIWTDDMAWADILNNFKNIADLIKETGAKGIAIDTEPYNSSLFNSKTERFKSVSRDILKNMVYQRGKEIMQVLVEVFPDIEVILLHEGGYHWYEARDKEYELWMDFFNGMASVKNRKGIVVASEGTYSIVDNKPLAKQYFIINNTMQKRVHDRTFWNNKCSIAIGMWPLGKEYSDKSARYSAKDFKEQFSQAVELSPRYVWIYDHGAAWFQLTKEDVDKYTNNGRWIWEKRYQILPADPAIQDYYTVIKGHSR